MQTLMEMLNIFGRILTILPLLLLITLWMGKRSIGELPVFDFLVIITLGSVVGADIADPDINHIFTFVAIIVIAAFQYVISTWSVKQRSFGRLVTFEPTVVMKDGMFLVDNLRKIRYSIDNVLQMLREKDIFDLKEVDTAIIEASGNLSVYKKAEKQDVKIEDMGLVPTAPGMAYTLIADGQLYPEVLYAFRLDEKWLQNELQERRIPRIEDVFFASINEEQELHISLKAEGYAMSEEAPLKH
jgi:uncharacterized membrane protein YcaP (DUF421 family)